MRVEEARQNVLRRMLSIALEMTFSNNKNTKLQTRYGRRGDSFDQMRSGRMPSQTSDRMLQRISVTHQNQSYFLVP
jgi:hypothetical protein